MKVTFTVEVGFDESVTDAESVAVALDRLMETACSTPGILDEYGNPDIGEFFPREASADDVPSAPDLWHAAEAVRQYLCEGDRLEELESSDYDFARALHMLARAVVERAFKGEGAGFAAPLPAQRVLELHDALIEATESFEALCPTLPYLYAAILRRTYIDCDDTSEDMEGNTDGAEDDPVSLLAMLRTLYPPEHWVWQHVVVNAPAVRDGGSDLPD